MSGGTPPSRLDCIRWVVVVLVAVFTDIVLVTPRWREQSVGCVTMRALDLCDEDKLEYFAGYTRANCPLKMEELEFTFPRSHLILIFNKRDYPPLKNCLSCFVDHALNFLLTNFI